MSKRDKWLVAIFAISALSYAYWKLAIPTHRLPTRSTLVMLGDLDGDHRWTTGDLKRLDAFLANPFRDGDESGWALDINQNRVVDEEDVSILRALVAASGDPYAAEEAAQSQGAPFPRPRELYVYVPVGDYRPQPVWALPYRGASDSVLAWFKELTPGVGAGRYSDALNAELYSECVRFDKAWRRRAPELLPVERDYAQRKLAAAQKLWDENRRYALLLALIELVEDAETLTVRNQPDFSLKLLAMRDHFREVFDSPSYQRFEDGTGDWREVLRVVAGFIRADTGLEYDFETLGRPRDLTHLENYLQRAEWQYYKSTTRQDDFRALIGYAQSDSRYLRSVSRTTRRLQDTTVENHNLPMVLLFREALRIKGGTDKKRAVGLLDEAIRVPYAWIQRVPRERLPGSLALDNFLLPGNKEDGADKSRHWNVFGGICLYRSPEESLDLALRREMQDLREGQYSKEAMREFLRDMIANLNGMFHVLTVNAALLAVP